MIANICGCHAGDSEALLQCLRAKSSEELLDISQASGREGVGAGCPLSGVVDRAHHSFIYFDLGLGKIQMTKVVSKSLTASRWVRDHTCSTGLQKLKSSSRAEVLLESECGEIPTSAGMQAGPRGPLTNVSHWMMH